MLCVGYALVIYVKFLVDSLLTSKEMRADVGLQKVACSLGDLSLVLCFVTVFV